MIKRSLSLLILIMLTFVVLISGCDGIKTRKTNIKNTDIALLSIFSFDGKKESTLGLMNLGHSFLSLENISSIPIEISNVVIYPGETIAIGTWSIKSHFGVWYNVESNYIADYNKYDGRISVTTGISTEDIDKITQYIISHDYWTPLTNCSCFALNLWNEVAEDGEILDRPLIYNPTAIAKQLVNFENYEINREINTDKDFYYFEGTTQVFHHLEDSYASV